MGMIIQNGKVFSGEPKTTYAERVLWLGPATPATSGLDITFSDTITNYDEIIFDLTSENGRKYQASFLVSSLTIGSTYLEALYAAEAQGVFWTYTNGTSINIKRITTGAETAITYNKIVGVKHGDVIKKEDYYKYSTDEHVVGEWIDGSTIYEKTVHVQPTGNVSDYTTFAFISGINVVLSTQFFAKRYTNGITYYYTGNGTSSSEAVSLTQYKLGVRVSNGNVQYYVSGYGAEITDIYATLRYTKATS